jgi:hypothetical protein
MKESLERLRYSPAIAIAGERPVQGTDGKGTELFGQDLFTDIEPRWKFMHL